jgi:small subunit ribosomal protein S8
MTDPIADMLTRIRNAQAVHKSDIVVPFSKIKLAIAEILHRQGYISNVTKEARGTAGNAFDQIRITLKYTSSKEPAIKNLKRISKPGRRVYAASDKLPVVLNNLGFAIISTPAGLMTNKDAKKQGVGGEVICEIY